MDITIEQALQKAIEAHKAGNLQDAEALYRAILQIQPKHPDANHNLGVLAVSINKTEASLSLFKTALEAKPNQGQFWVSYIDALIKEKQFDNAKSVLEKGKKLGLAGERVNALEALLKVHQNDNPDITDKIQNTKNTKGNKRTPTKKEKKKKQITGSLHSKSVQASVPPQSEINNLLLIYRKGDYETAKILARSFTRRFANHQFGWKILGASLQKTGAISESVKAYQKAVGLSPNDAEGHYNLGIALIELGKLEDAEISYRKALAIKPDFAEAHSNLGNILKELGRIEDAGESYRKALTIKPDFPAALSNLGAVYKELGKLDEAVTSYRKALAIKPDYAEAHSNLGNALKVLGNIEEAEICYRNALIVKPDYVAAHYNLGNALKELGKLADAVASYKNALAINADYAEVHANLGIALKELGKLEDAEVSFRKAVEIKPDFAEAYSNLGLTLQELGKLEEAEAIYRKALAIKPDLPEAYSNLGVALKELGKLEDAEMCYRKALAIKPDFAEAHSNLSNALKELGRIEDALNAVVTSIIIKPTIEAKSLFVEIIKNINPQSWNLLLSQMTVSALLEPWGRPSNVMQFACRLLKKSSDYIQFADALLGRTAQAINENDSANLFVENEYDFIQILQAMLASAPIADAEIEVLLTTLRRHLLKAAVHATANGDRAEFLATHCALAQQCFINEYVYFETAEETDEAQNLRNRLTKALESDQNIPDYWIVALACYYPLDSINGVEELLTQNWSDGVRSVLRQQVEEPLEVFNLRSTIPRLTSIDNQISLSVQGQYEENPYPRWVRLSRDSNKTYFNTFMQSHFPLSGFNRLVDDKNLDVLIAGCGTGQHPISTEQLFKGIEILAVDLSMSSLAYAKRKAIELGSGSIEFAQADILKLASFGKTFDVIDSSGVLHHLEKPLEGWEVLLSLLRPHGLMRLGFYSELARRDIVRARKLIVDAGIGASSQEIRNFRQHLLELSRDASYGFATSSADFYTTSTCRDLLFHVQEHRMNLDMISRFLADHQLKFLGFNIDPSVIGAYKKRFPSDPSATNLDLWRTYEEENPDTFKSMYQFWIQKGA